jgi:hypothetical protein
MPISSLAKRRVEGHWPGGPAEGGVGRRHIATLSNQFQTFNQEPFRGALHKPRGPGTPSFG